MERIRSGLLGNTEAIEDLGINVNVALIESTKAFRQFANGRSWQQLDFNTQQTIRYFAILEQAASKYGLELAQNTTSRQAAFVAQLKNAQLALGQAFLPIYNTVLPALTRMATALANAAQYLAAFTQALFGSKANQQTKATEQQAGAVSDLGDAYEEAGKQAKGAVAGFDQINLIGQNTAGATGGGAIEVPSLETTETEGALKPLADSMNNVSEKAQQMAKRVREAFKNMSDFISQHKEIIIAALTAIGTAFATFFVVSKWQSIVTTITAGFGLISGAFATVLSPLGLVAGAIGALTGAFIYFYQTNETFRGLVEGIFAKIGQTVQWIWESVFVPFGEWLAEVMPVAWKTVTDAVQWLWKNILAPFGEFLLWIWHNALEPIAKVLADVLATAFKLVADIAKEFWQKVLVPLGKALSDMFKPAVEAVSAVLEVLWNKVLKPLGEFLINQFKKNLTAITDAFVYMWQKVLKPMADYIGGAFKTVFSNVIETIGSIIEAVKRSFIGLMNFITGVFTQNWKQAWYGIQNFFGGIWDGIVGMFKGAINIIIDAMNWLIRQLNKIRIDLPGWVEDLTGVGSIGINIPEIPRLAKGGLAYGPTLAMVGDNRGAYSDPEVIAPLSKLEGIIDSKGDNKEVVAVLKRVEQAVRDLRYVQAVISRSEIGRAAIETIKDEQRRTGRLPFPV